MILKKEEAKYVATFNEAIPIVVSGQVLREILKVLICVVFGALLAGTIITGDNLFMEMSGLGLITLVGLLIALFFGRKTQMTPAPMEIWFFEDHLVMLKIKHYYSKKLSRKEYDKIYYKDIRLLKWNEVTQQITFHGLFEILWYNYNPDGTVQPVAAHDRTSEAMTSFYFNLCPEINFLALFHAYVPCNVDVTYKRSNRSTN